MSDVKRKSREQHLLRKAREFCSKHDLRFTDLRQQVYCQIAKTSSIGAYEIARNLSSLGRNINAVSVYRTLEFLLSSGLVYRISSSKKFAASPLNDVEGGMIDVVLICKNSGTIEKISSAEFDEFVSRLTKDAGFEMERAIVEIEGKQKPSGRSLK